MSTAELRTAINRLDDDVRDSFDLIELDEPVMDHAIAMARIHALRGADAVQLACLVLAQRRMPQIQFQLLSADDELNAAAVTEGFQVENPNLHP